MSNEEQSGSQSESSPERTKPAKFELLFPIFTEAEREDSRIAARVSHKYPAEQRERILENVKPRIFSGERIGDLAAEHGIPLRTLHYWLAQLGDEYRNLRRAWIDSKLVDAEELIYNAATKLDAMKAKELFKVASWYAERRDPERYAPKQEITHHSDEARTPEQIRERITQLENRLGVKTLDAEVEA